MPAPTQEQRAAMSRGNRICGSCKEEKPLTDFYASLRTRLNSKCIPCQAAYQREYKLRPGYKAQRRRSNLAARYGLSVEQYDALLAAQGGVCAVCGGPPADGQPLAVDHDHTCCPDYRKTCGECVRGLLCRPCNKGVGHFRDDPNRLLAAAAYLMTTKEQFRA